MLRTQHGHLDYQTRRTRSGRIWARVHPCSHGRRSATVQPYRSVFSGRQSYLMKQSCRKAIPRQKWPCESKFQKVNPGLPEAVTRLSKVGDQLIRWPCVAKKPAFMLLHEFMHVGHSYSATLTTATSIRQWSSNSAGEEQTDLLCNTWRASVHVQRQHDCSATFTAPKVKKIIAPTNRELRQQSTNSYDVWILM